VRKLLNITDKGIQQEKVENGILLLRKQTTTNAECFPRKLYNMSNCLP
jgi:hypothetical protein